MRLHAFVCACALMHVSVFARMSANPSARPDIHWYDLSPGYMLLPPLPAFTPVLPCAISRAKSDSRSLASGMQDSVN